MSVFVVLGILWAAVLVPPVLRARAERRAEFIDSFRRQMGALGRKAGAGRMARIDPLPRGPAAIVAMWGHPADPAKRRRDILGGLLGAMIGSFLLGLIPSLRSVWILLLFLVNLSIAYVALLAHYRRRHVRAARLAAARGRSRQPEPSLSPAFDRSR